MDVGNRLREVRIHAGLSQRELAKKAGVTNSAISMIEKNSVSPSVSSLKKVLAGIPLSLMEFFDDADKAALIPPVVYRQDDLLTQSAEGITSHLIGQYTNNRQMSFMKEVMEPGSTTGEEAYAHEGEETGIVIEGAMELTVDNETYVIKKGEGYYFDSNRKHSFSNPFDEPCVLISCTAPANF